MHRFVPPTRLESRSSHPLFGRLRWAQGLTVLKEGEFYRQVRDPSAEEVEAADVAYLGGREYLIEDDAEAADLQAAGYGAYIEELTDAYGWGAYGSGEYGG